MRADRGYEFESQADFRAQYQGLRVIDRLEAKSAVEDTNQIRPTEDRVSKKEAATAGGLDFMGRLILPASLRSRFFADRAVLGEGVWW